VKIIQLFFLASNCGAARGSTMHCLIEKSNGPIGGNAITGFSCGFGLEKFISYPNCYVAPRTKKTSWGILLYVIKL